MRAGGRERKQREERDGAVQELDVAEIGTRGGGGQEEEVG